MIMLKRYLRKLVLNDHNFYKTNKMTATEYGSLMHTVMQHLDFHGDLSDKAY